MLYIEFVCVCGSFVVSVSNNFDLDQIGGSESRLCEGTKPDLISFNFWA